MAERLVALLPIPFNVRVHDDVVVVSSADEQLGGSGAAEIVENRDDRTVEQRVEVAVMAILSAIQDIVSHELTEPWPIGTDGNMALPYVVIDHARLHLGFGEFQGRPMLPLDPIDLAVLSGGDAASR